PNGVQPAAPKARSAEEAAKLFENFKANADAFDMTLDRGGLGDPKVDLRTITLHSASRKFEPSPIGPGGQPIFKPARISKEQALKIMDALDTWALFFRVASEKKPVSKDKKPILHTQIRFGPDPALTLHMEQSWTWKTAGQLAAIRACVDG